MVKVWKLTLDQLVKIQILLLQLSLAPVLQDLVFLLVTKPSPILTCPQTVLVTVVVEKAVAAFAGKCRIRRLRTGVLI